MNRLAECTPGPYENDDGTIHADGAGIATVATLDDFPCIDHSDNEACMAIERECAANADLLALAYDNALFAAAVWVGAATISTETDAIRVWDGFLWREFKVGTTPFRTPSLTPESREALRRAIGVGQ